MNPRWAFEPLGQLCKTGAGGTPLKSVKEYYANGDVPWLLSGEVHQGEINQAKNFITQKGLENSSAKLFPPNTLLIAMYGATAGAVGILRFQASTNQAICGVLPSEKFIPEFLYYYFTHIKNELVAQAAGNAQPNISQEKIRNTCVPVATLDEQRRIVTLLDEAFADIATAKANAEKNLQNARELASELSAQTLSAPSANCTTQSLEDIVEADCSLSYGIVQPGDEFESGLPIVRPVDLDRPLIELDGLKRIDPTLAKGYERTKLKGGEVLLCVRGTTGTLSCASSTLAGANVTRGIVPIRFNTNCISQELGYFLMRSAPVQAQIRAKTYGTALMQINIRDLRQIQIPVPHTSQQATIAKALQDAEDQTNRLAEIQSQKLIALDDLKKSLLHNAFSSQL